VKTIRLSVCHWTWISCSP